MGTWRHPQASVDYWLAEFEIRTAAFDDFLAHFLRLCCRVMHVSQGKFDQLPLQPHEYFAASATAQQFPP